MTIGQYEPRPAELLECDPRFPAVAGAIRAVIREADRALDVLHVGSTAVPGLRGKGVIDLAVLYPAGHLAAARDSLDRLGFQRQQGRDPFPESRPMRVGSWIDGSRVYRIHAHVIATDSREHPEVVWFRDRLRADPELLERYEVAKRAIIASGITDSYDYAVAKGQFVAALLANWRAGLPAGRAGTVTIGKELAVNRIGFGTMRLPGPGVWGEPTDPDQALALLRRAVALGVNLIDTADYYGPEVANRLVFEALHPYPQDLVIATKVGFRRGSDRSWQPDHRPERIRAAVHDNLGRLRRDWLDLVHFRFGDTAGVPLAESLGALADLVTEGKVRHVGLSHVSVEQLPEAERTVPIASISNIYSLANRSAEPVLAWCAERGVPFLPFFPLGGGVLNQPDGPLALLARERGTTPGQLALAWLLARSPIVAPIPGTSSIHHLEQNVLAGAIRLTTDEADQILTTRRGAP